MKTMMIAIFTLATSSLVWADTAPATPATNRDNQQTVDYLKSRFLADPKTPLKLTGVSSDGQACQVTITGTNFGIDFYVNEPQVAGQGGKSADFRVSRSGKTSEQLQLSLSRFSLTGSTNVLSESERTNDVTEETIEVTWDSVSVPLNIKSIKITNNTESDYDANGKAIFDDKNLESADCSIQ